MIALSQLAVETKGSVVAHGGAILPLSGKLATTIGSSSIAASTKNTEQVAPDAPRNDPKWQALPVAPQTVQALATFQPPAVAVAKLVNAAQPEVFETATKSIATESLFGLAASDRTFAATQSVTSAAPTTSAQTARHVAGQIAVANLTGKATEIALNPEELGRVRLTMTAVDGTITLNVLAERLETNDLLRRHIDVLAQEFRDLGYDTISFSFGAEAQPETPTDASPFEDGEQSETDQATETDINLQANPSSGLDLRL